MIETIQHKHARRLIASALSASLAVTGVPALLAVPSAYAADSANTAVTATATATPTTLKDGTYTADVGFTCKFEIGPSVHDMSSILPENSKATIKVENGVATATVAFGTGTYVISAMGTTTDTHQQVYLSDSYTNTHTNENASVAVGVSTTESALGSSDYKAATYEKNADSAITSLSFPVSADTSTYYLQTAISGAGGMAFPYTTSQGNTYYVSISIDWSTLAATDGGSDAADSALAQGTYSVPVSIMNASNTSEPSMAASAFESPATLTVAADGSSTVNVKLKDIVIGTLTGHASNVKVYSGELGSNTIDATVVSGQASAPSEISFALPAGAYGRGGVYLNMRVDAMGYSPDVFMKIDFANAKQTSSSNTKKVTSANANKATVNAAVVKKAIGANTKTVTSFTLGKKVKKISSGTFKGTNVKTLVVKTKKLTKASVKGSLKGSRVSTVQVKVGSKKANVKYVKSYKKIFTKKITGKKATVK